MEDLLSLIRRRRSIRRFQRRPLPKEILERLIEAARWAPSASNVQPWQFIVVTDEEVRRAVGREARFLFVKSYHVAEAPAIIVICGDPRSPFYLHDCCIAGTHILLEAAALGLGTCWIGLFKEERIKEILRIPERWKVVALIAVGYPAEEPTPPPRLKLEEVLHWEGFGGKGPPLRRRLFGVGPLTVLPRYFKMLLRRGR